MPRKKPGTATATVTARDGTVTHHATIADAAAHAVRVAMGAGKRDAALGRGEQRDIEDPDQAGVHPEQKEREAQVGGIAADRLRSIIERVERLEDERKALAGDIKDVMAEAKSAGFDVKVIREILKQRRQEPAEVEEQETLLDLYRRALGM
jgi:uncharacterized protein (UPF0335 family)